MTITIKRRTAILFVALTCLLGGLALGQLTQAKSASSDYQFSEVTRELKKISGQLGATYRSGSVIYGLNQIESELGGLDNRLQSIEKTSAGTCNSVKSGFGTFYTC